MLPSGPRPRRLVWLPLLGLAFALLVVAPARGTSPCEGRQAVGEWAEIAAPTFAVGSPELVTYDISWADPDLMLATNGRAVARSTDGGCTWDERWSTVAPPPPDMPDPLADLRPWLDQGRIVQVAADPEGDPDRFVMVVHDAGSPLGGSATVLLTDDGGATVRTPTVPPAPAADGAFPETCPPQAACRLEHARADGDVLTLTSAPGPIAPGVVWRSEDRGDTWQPVSTSAGAGDVFDTTFRGIAPAVSSPADARSLVAGIGCRTVERSADGGRTWSPVPVPLREGGIPVGLAVAQEPGRPWALAVVQHADYCTGATVDAVHLTRDAGATWVTAELAAQDLDGVALDRAGSTAALTDETGSAWLVGADGAVASLTPPGGRALFQPLATGHGDLAFVSDDAILVLGAGGDRPVAARARVIPPVADLGTCPEDAVTAPSATAPARVTVARPDLELPVSGTGEVAAEAVVPPRPVPVDVFAVLDASGSMQDAIDSLGETVVSAASGLAAEDIDLHLGVAEFRARNTVAYRRLLAVAPVDCRVGRALATIEPDGVDETHLIALREAVSGGGLPELGIVPDQDARFRDDALRVVLHATDEPFTEDQPYDPSLADVATAFQRAGAAHVGVRVLTDAPVDAGPTGIDDTRVALDRIGAAVGTRAPDGGLDCDGDGLTDVPPGAPVTCTFGSVGDQVRGDGLGGVLARVVRAMVVPVPVRLEAVSAGPIEVLSDASAVDVDPRDGAAVSGAVALRCPAEPVDATVEVRATVAGQVVATQPLTVSCVAGAAAAPAADVPAPGQPATATAPAPALPPAAPNLPPAAPIAGAAPAAASAGASAASSASATSAASSSATATSSTLVGVPAEEAEADVATTLAATRRGPSPVLPLSAGLLVAATAWGLHTTPKTTRRTQENRP